MRLLLVNWQDRENPLAGGAEIHLHEIFGRLGKRGHEVTLLCGGWPGHLDRTQIDGMDVHRVGTRAAGNRSRSRSEIRTRHSVEFYYTPFCACSSRAGSQ